jgi:hypothetical protein
VEGRKPLWYADFGEMYARYIAGSLSQQSKGGGIWGQNGDHHIFEVDVDIKL